MKLYNQTEMGLTLIEVLIALVILSIALTAVIKSTAQNIRNTLYLQNKTIATWIGADAINHIRTGLLKIPSVPAHLTQSNITLGQQWSYEATLETTPNPHIKKIVITIFHQPDNNTLTHLESFMYVSP